MQTQDLNILKNALTLTFGPTQENINNGEAFLK